jgi:hypothetical protein
MKPRRLCDRRLEGRPRVALNLVATSLLRVHRIAVIAAAIPCFIPAFRVHIQAEIDAFSGKIGEKSSRCGLLMTALSLFSSRNRETRVGSRIPYLACFGGEKSELLARLSDRTVLRRSFASENGRAWPEFHGDVARGRSPSDCLAERESAKQWKILFNL